MANMPRGRHAAASSPEVAKPRHRKLRIVLISLLSLFVVACAGVGIVCAMWLQDLPDWTDASSYNSANPTTVLAADQTTVLARFQFENREPLSSLDQISAYAVEGTVATEDERFYKHGGVDLIGIGRALINNMTGGSLEGASTITQQLVRNTLIADEMTDISIKRKVREAYLSIKLEGEISKEEILLTYMNTINYGSGAYGIEAAAKRYYSKSASELTLSEAATLVGIPQSPTYNNPIDFPDHALARRNIVLDRMVSYGAISQAEADAVKAEPIVLNPSVPSNDGILKYPYFSSYVRDQLTNSYSLSTSDVFKGGLTVYTTLDPAIQDMAEQAAMDKLDGFDEDLDLALTAIDPDSGYIKAMVGGKDYYANQWNLATQARRQPGSSFKTFTLVTALEQGISPSTMVNCNAEIKLADWEVANISHIDYDTRSIASAFAVSSNTGFARLITAVGPQSVVDTAHRMGIESELSPTGALTLGASVVTTVEMADAYATIANGGTHHDPVGILKVVDASGKTIIDNTSPQGEQALSPEVAFAATQVMEGVIRYGTATDARLSSGQVAAGKTGTSDDYKDIWFCGITPQLSVAIWMGDPSNVKSVPEHTGVSDVFAHFMDMFMVDRPLEQFPTAATPVYTKTFSNDDLDIKNIYYEKDEDEEDEDKDKDKDKGKDKDKDKDKNPEKPTNPVDPEKPVDPDPEPKPDPDPEPDPEPDPDPEPEPDPAGVRIQDGTAE